MSKTLTVHTRDRRPQVVSVVGAVGDAVGVAIGRAVELAIGRAVGEDVGGDVGKVGAVGAVGAVVLLDPEMLRLSATVPRVAFAYFGKQDPSSG